MFQVPTKRPPLTKLNDYSWEISKDYKNDAPKMQVPARIFASKKLLDEMDLAVYEQISNVAALPGIVKAAMVMPDAHWGYGFPIGGVAAFDLDKGIVSPGGIGYDINCGMRLIRTDFTLKEIEPKLKQLVDSLFRLVPAGVGRKGFVRITGKDWRDVAQDGAQWCIKKGYGFDKDKEHIEDYGAIAGADASEVSDKAVKRGVTGLGTLGSGNHYLEIQVIKKENIFDEKIAKTFGLFPGQVVVMVHTGSRGLGHQICTDYVDLFRPKLKDWGIDVRDQELSCAPINSKEAERYLKAMRSAANYAFANRQVITHQIRKGFSEAFGKNIDNMGMELIYDVAHNIAKEEQHIVDGKKKKVLVHRKGATRCFGPERSELANIFRKTGQPVIVGGSMETGSYLCVGTTKAEEETFGSTMHGAGRTMSRTAAMREFQGEQLQKSMEKKGIYVHAVSMSGLAEEAGKAYKDINEVIDTMDQAGISKKVVRFLPIGNVKG